MLTMPLSTPPSSLFPTYLLPTLPFRRRSSSSTTFTTSNRSSVSTENSFDTSPDQPTYLNGALSLLRCSRCLTHLCPTTAIISKGFTGRHGRAYLVAPPTAPSGLTPPSTPRHHSAGNLPNTHAHKPVPRQLVTGAHTVSDISCVVCGAILGWKYVNAEEESQKYKVGKFILETKRVIRGVCWENEGGRADDDLVDAFEEAGGVAARRGGAGEVLDEADEDVEFDSQDEDECEDLFAGVWSPTLARKRRRNKMWREGVE